ncbi:unnamed protein product [Staurois parvus]|uniref:Uncharacterized protein n=1 Tax=Staurois parvus TaxID=386267 RepID=A0ABN9GM57_9NEOB|nr:unnamed protein product [Staurois parvus]
MENLRGLIPKHQYFISVFFIYYTYRRSGGRLPNPTPLIQGNITLEDSRPFAHIKVCINRKGTGILKQLISRGNYALLLYGP